MIQAVEQSEMQRCAARLCASGPDRVGGACSWRGCASERLGQNSDESVFLFVFTDKKWNRERSRNLFFLCSTNHFVSCRVLSRWVGRGVPMWAVGRRLLWDWSCQEHDAWSGCLVQTPRMSTWNIFLKT